MMGGVTSSGYDLVDRAAGGHAGGCPAGGNGLGGGDDLKVVLTAGGIESGNLGDLSFGVGEDVRGEVDLGKGEDDAGTQARVLRGEIGEERFVQRLRLVGFGGDGVDEVGAGGSGLIRATKEVGDGFGGRVTDGAKLEEIGDDHLADGANGIVSLEIGQ